MQKYDFPATREQLDSLNLNHTPLALFLSITTYKSVKIGGRQKLSTKWEKVGESVLKW
jgi:hypothetical protein